jgi:hypothetical protein
MMNSTRIIAKNKIKALRSSSVMDVYFEKNVSFPPQLLIQIYLIRNLLLGLWCGLFRLLGILGLLIFFHFLLS